MTYSKNLPIKDTLHKMDTSLCPNGVRLREVPLYFLSYKERIRQAQSIIELTKLLTVKVWFYPIY